MKVSIVPESLKVVVFVVSELQEYKINVAQNLIRLEVDEFGLGSNADFFCREPLKIARVPESLKVVVFVVSELQEYKITVERLEKVTVI